MATDEEGGRARRRWRLLREAIIRSCQQQQQHARRAAAVADEEGEGSTPSTTVVYAVPGIEGAVLLLPAPRPSSTRASGLEQLISHRLTGVDFTGSVRIWPAEEALLAWCMQQRPHGYFGGKRVLELGAGMAGLAGLGLAYYADPPPAEVVLTDGHPDCVTALEACVALNRERLRCPVRVERLVWGKHEDGPAEAGVDVVLGADLLFFEDFHAGLLDLLASVLRPDEGEACLLQPSRGGALERFVARARGGGVQGARWDLVEEGTEGAVVDEQQLRASSENDRLRLLQLRLVRSGEGRGLQDRETKVELNGGT